MSEWGAPPEGPRRAPLPPFLKLPGFAWRRLSRGQRRGIVVVLVVLAAAGAVLFAGADAVRDERRRESEANLERIRRELVADQRPRHGGITARSRARHPAVTGEALVAAALEDAVAADVRARFARDRDPVASCERFTPRGSATTRREAFYVCFATVDVDRFATRDLETGYRFRARADLRAGTFAWCKLNPRPIHADQEEFVSVPLSEECSPT